MAKRHKKRNKKISYQKDVRRTETKVQRDTNDISKLNKLLESLRKQAFPTDRERDIAIRNDLRRWIPNKPKIVTVTRGLRQKSTRRMSAAEKSAYFNSDYYRQQQKKWREEEICRKRRQRREMLFKQRKAGKGISGPKFKKYTDDSDVRC